MVLTSTALKAMFALSVVSLASGAQVSDLRPDAPTGTQDNPEDDLYAAGARAVRQKPPNGPRAFEMEPTGMSRGFMNGQYVIGIAQETTEDADINGFLVRTLPTMDRKNGHNYDPNPDNGWRRVLPPVDPRHVGPGSSPGKAYGLNGKAYSPVKNIIERYLRGEDIRGERFTTNEGTFEIGYLYDPNWFGEGWYIMPVIDGIVNTTRRFPIRFQGKHFFEHGQMIRPPRYALEGPTQSQPLWGTTWYPSAADDRWFQEADELTPGLRHLAHIPDGATAEEADDILQREVDYRRRMMDGYGRFPPPPSSLRCPQAVLAY